MAIDPAEMGIPVTGMVGAEKAWDSLCECGSGLPAQSQGPGCPACMTELPPAPDNRIFLRPGSATGSFSVTEIPAEILDPQTGEIVEAGDADQLIDAWDRLKEMEAACRDFKTALATALCALTTDFETKTRRVRGQRRRAKIEMPDSSWEQSRLKEAWFAYPQYRDEFLTIATLRPKLLEVKKMLSEVGGLEFETFKKLLLSADLGPRGLPSVTVEE